VPPKTCTFDVCRKATRFGHSPPSSTSLRDARLGGAEHHCGRRATPRSHRVARVSLASGSGEQLPGFIKSPVLHSNSFFSALISADLHAHYPSNSCRTRDI